MPELLLSSHAKDMLAERAIPEDWLWQAITDPDNKWTGDDGNMHYAKAIREKHGRGLHVVVNVQAYPNRVVTVFFDRRLGKGK